MSGGFSGANTSDKFFQYKKSQSFLTTENEQLFMLKSKWVEVIIVTFLNAIATVDVLTASKNDINFVKTPTVHFALLLNRCFVLRE